MGGYYVAVSGIVAMAMATVMNHTIRDPDKVISATPSTPKSGKLALQ